MLPARRLSRAAKNEQFDVPFLYHRDSNCQLSIRMLLATRAARHTVRRKKHHIYRNSPEVQRKAGPQSFHSCRVLYESSKGSTTPPPNKDGSDRDEPEPVKDHRGGEKISESGLDGDAINGPSPAMARGGRLREAYGSGTRRALRNRVPKEIPPVVLPDWFTEKNIILYGQQSVVEAKNVLKPDGDSYSSTPTDAQSDCHEPTFSSLHDDIRGMTMPSMIPDDFSELFEECQELMESLVSAVEILHESTSSADDSSKGKLLQENLSELCATHDLTIDKGFASELNAGELRSIIAEFLAWGGRASQHEARSETVGLPVHSERNQSVIDMLVVVRKVKETIQERLGGNPGSRHQKLDNGHRININIFNELVSTCRASLLLQSPSNLELKDIPRPNTLLHCPDTDGNRFLDAVARGLASELEVDLLRLDPDDCAELVGPYTGENLAWTFAQSSLLGYDARKLSGKVEDFESGKERPAEEDPSEDTTTEIALGSGFLDPEVMTERLKKLFSKAGSRQKPQGVLMELSSDSSSQPISFGDFLGSSASSGSQATPVSTDAWSDLKISSAFGSLINAVTKKREASEQDSPDDLSLASQSKGLMIHIPEYMELDSTGQGQMLLRKLREVVKKRWFDGERIFILGTTSAEIPGPLTSKFAVRKAQADIARAECRTIFVPPPHDSMLQQQFELEEQRYISDINFRHIEDMIIKMGGIKEIDEKGFIRSAHEWPLSHHKILDYGQVYRIAVTALGARSEAKPLSCLSIGEAIKSVHLSDKAKFAWLDSNSAEALHLSNMENISTEPKVIEKKKLEKLKAGANRHEKKLLGGIVQPSGLNTSFIDVRAPIETIEALKTLTSLSLQRPDAFKYGILATQKIPGILLYGPPGTGKTMLAKAVAKESGATVLEVSGSEINDMYVGEGEKNVKALFSLAKKLSPCIIFIDEADAIFAARGGGSSKRSSHKELINQFLRELDGMTDFTGLLMVATNRPFDLDEAVLRRLPRRILVDLPLEQDRKEILKLHLSSEVLDPSVDLEALAKDTPLYSGSDLKNLSVAAALACVREENELASKHTGTDPYTYPEKRVLTGRHFDQAKEEISASISEDMSTLKAIRKFDERYGDRKGRRKKSSGMGFTGMLDLDRDSEAGRVRKLAASVA